MFSNLRGLWRASTILPIVAWAAVIGMVWRLLVLGGDGNQLWLFFFTVLVALGASLAHFAAKSEHGDKTAALWRPSTIIATLSWLSVLGMVWYLFFLGGSLAALWYLFLMVLIAFGAIIATYAKPPAPKAKVNVVERTTRKRVIHERTSKGT